MHGMATEVVILNDRFDWIERYIDWFIWIGIHTQTQTHTIFCFLEIGLLSVVLAALKFTPRLGWP